MARRRGRPVHGWLVIDKPVGMTSTQVVGRARRLLDSAKAGHGGTLDPNATGVLPIAFGEATKTVAYAMQGRKTYRFTVRWGEARETDDVEGAVSGTSPVRPDRAAIEAVLPRFTGVIQQVPPVYSAIKVDGNRSYDLARAGEAVALAARPVRIDSLELLEQPDADHAVFEAECGKGAYIRALARDMAQALGTLGHLTAIRRLSVGPFGIDDSITLDHLAALAEKTAAESALLPVETPLDDIPAVALTEAEAQRMRNGNHVALLRRSDRDRLARLAEDAEAGRGGSDDAIVLAVVPTPDGDRPVALARLDGAELHPVRILNL
ncbi:MAG: tRNA pseudouridine(55) synthase TruB [Inquilinus sp.]|nr:tRNA pseudouridine(55) synthase TruB [Inquilinus sp.]